MLAYCTGEMFLLKRKHVILPRTARQSAVLFLENAKTAQRNMLPGEKVLIQEQAGTNALRYFCAGLEPDDSLVVTSVVKFRAISGKKWSTIWAFRNVIACPIACEEAQLQQRTMKQLLLTNFWKRAAGVTLPHQALQEYASINLPIDKLPAIRAAQRRFVAAKLGMRGRGS